jgi:hypothetical protein
VRFVFDVSAIGIDDAPFVTGEDPAIDTLGMERANRFLGGVGRNQFLLDDGQVRSTIPPAL